MVIFLCHRLLIICSFLFMQFPLNKLSGQLREQTAQAGFTEAMTFCLVCILYSNCSVQTTHKLDMLHWNVKCCSQQIVASVHGSIVSD